MDLNLKKENNKYIMNIEFSAKWNIEEIWDFMATNDGLSKWFPELSLKNEELHFNMDDFHEVMIVIENEKNETLYFNWDKAKVRFTLEDNVNQREVKLNEEMEFDFPNKVNDMTGWLVHMTRLEKIFNNEKAESLDILIKPCEDKIEKMFEEIK